MIGEIRPDHPLLARALTELVRTHGYDKLMALTRTVLEEASHG
jgi:hypothetical protein